MNSHFFATIKKSLNDYKMYGIEVMLSFILVAISCLLVLFMPSIPLFLLILIYLCAGISKFALSVIRTKKINYENIFLNFKSILIIYSSKILSLVISFLWTLLFIFPGILSFINYSFVSFIVADGEKSSYEALSKSKKLTQNVRFQILIIYLSMILFALICLCASFGVTLLVNYIYDLPFFVDTIISIFLSLLPLYLFILPFEKLCISNIYIEQKTIFDGNEKEFKKVASRR